MHHVVFQNAWFHTDLPYGGKGAAACVPRAGVVKDNALGEYVAGFSQHFYSRKCIYGS